MFLKDLSRRSFLKGALAGSAAVMAGGLSLGALAEEKGVYTPGTYSAPLRVWAP